MKSTSILAVGMLAAALLSSSVALAQETTRASIDSQGDEGAYGASSRRSAVSADGWIVAFESIAPDFVNADHNLSWDVFVHDRATGQTERVSVDSTGVEGNADSYYPALSKDGRFVTFMSHATNLVAADNNSVADIFLFDRVLRTTVRISVNSSGAEADKESYEPRISEDGGTVAFYSAATNLVPNDTNGAWDVFVRQLPTAQTIRASVTSLGVESNGYSYDVALSADGNVVAFATEASNLDAADTNGRDDVFVHELSSGLTTCASRTSSGANSNGDCYQPSLSENGVFVAFAGWASNFVTGDTNFMNDVFVCDRVTGAVERVSVSSSGAQANGGSLRPTISANGQVVCFESSATNLVSNDTNGVGDVLQHDRSTGESSILSIDTGGSQGVAGSFAAKMSADGMVIVFEGQSSNLVPNDTNGANDVFVRERCERAAWSTYGAGFPGSNGIPTLTPQALPILGTTIVVDVSSSAPGWTIACVLAGLQQASIPMKKGGSILVLPLESYIFALPPSGTTISQYIQPDLSIAGLEVFAQSLIVDPGAAKGQSCSAGLALTLGH